MKTRAQAIASHCVITRIPVEIVTQILKFIPSDLRAVSGTCRYLRAVAGPLLYQDVTVVPTKRASFAPLEALGGKGRQERADLLRSLRIEQLEKPFQRPPANKAKSFSSIIVTSLGFLSNLSSISLPFPLLNNAAFQAIYNHPSINILEIVGEARGYQRPVDHLDLDSRVSLPPRPSILTVTRVATDLGFEGPTLLKSLVTFLTFHSVVVPSISVGLAYAFLPNAPVFNYPFLPDLTTLKFLVLPEAFESVMDLLETIVTVQTSLRNLNLRLSEVGEGFALNDRSWVSFLNGEIYHPVASFGAAWEGVRLHSVDTTFTRIDSDDDFMEDQVELNFFPGTTITPERAAQLGIQIPYADSLCFLGTGLRWSDWTSTISALKPEIDCIYSIFLSCSTTPIPTVATTLACSSSCYAKLARTHPSLHVASELVGGYGVVWRLMYGLNISRLVLLAPLFRNGGGRVYWHLAGKGGDLVNVVGEVDEAGFWVDLREEVKLPTEEKLKRCSCVGCGEVEEGADPITAVVACGVEQVRAALVVQGFDLDTFDSSSPSLPIDPESFESFLRSNT